MVQKFRQTRALIFPAIVVLGLIVALVAHLNAGFLGLIGAAGLISIILATPLALTGRIVVQNQVLQASGAWRPASTSESVNLNSLAGIHSVGWRYGIQLRFGPPFFRQLLRLDDTTGNTVFIWAWGWSPKKALMSLLREAAIQSDARVDKLTIRRLHIRS